MLFAGFFGDYRDYGMTHRYDMAECRVVFQSSLLDSVPDFVENASEDEINEYKEQLDDSLGVLADAVGNNDRSSFRGAMDDLREVWRETSEYLRDMRKEARSGLKGQERADMMAEIRADFDEKKDELQVCFRSAAFSNSERELEKHEHWMEVAKNATDSMEERDYDVSEIEDVLEEAEENAEILQDAVDNENEDILEIRRDVWMKHLHIWAKFNNKKMNLFLERIQERTEGYETELEEIQDLLDEAISIGDDEYYDAGEALEARAKIGEAREKLVDLVEEIRGEA